jgi:hypothetical protein
MFFLYLSKFFGFAGLLCVAGNDVDLVRHIDHRVTREISHEPAANAAGYNDLEFQIKSGHYF